MVLRHWIFSNSGISGISTKEIISDSESRSVVSIFSITEHVLTFDKEFFEIALLKRKTWINKVSKKTKDNTFFTFWYYTVVLKDKSKNLEFIGF